MRLGVFVRDVKQEVSAETTSWSKLWWQVAENLLDDFDTLTHRAGSGD